MLSLKRVFYSALQKHKTNSFTNKTRTFRYKTHKGRGTLTGVSGEAPAVSLGFFTYFCSSILVSEIIIL